VWGSEFTSKDATLQGDSAEIAPTLNVKMWTSVVVVVVVVAPGRELPLFSLILFLNLFEPSRTILNLRPKNLSREF
jgi:hypothetical protein